MATTSIIWSIKELVECLRKRQMNKFDANFGVSGKRGNGKSTLLFDIFNSFKDEGFDEEKHQVYSREDVVSLLSNQQFSFCWDDEAINSGYKRDFQNKGQQELIKIVTNYRDNYNIYGSALPFFYSLDKDLRELLFLHLHIIERGVAVVLMPIKDQIHSSDPWDTKHNIKIEEQEHKRCARSPKAKFRYSRFSTFVGYLYFGDMTENQRARYDERKKRKRAMNFAADKKGKEATPQVDFVDKAYSMLLEGKITRDGLLQACVLHNKKYSTVLDGLNTKLKDNGITKTVSELYVEPASERRKGVSKVKVGEMIPLI